MKRFLFLILVLLTFGCNNDTPKQQDYILTLKGNTYHLTEEAYNDLSSYLKFLEEYYQDEENCTQIVYSLENLIADGMEGITKTESDVVDKNEIEYIIENIRKQGIDGTPMIPGLEEYKYAPLTILSYLIANNNLDDDLLANIGTMYDGLAEMDKPAVLLVYWDGTTNIGNSSSKHMILKYETDGKGNINGKEALDLSYTLDDVLAIAEIVKEYPVQLSTDKQVMGTVLKDMIAYAPTSKLGLVFGSHGSSWLNTIYTSRSFGQDGSNTDNTILIPDMVNALASTGKTFEFILFDACYMGTAEVCHAFRNVADYQIVSVMEVPAYGFPYNEFLMNLYQGTVEGYKQVCKTYINYYKKLYESGSQAWGTVALVDSKEMQNMTDCLKKEIVAHKDLLSNYTPKNLQEYGRRSGQHIAYDMVHFIKELNDGNIQSSFNEQLGKTILFKECVTTANPSDYSVNATNYCGLGMYIPIAARPNWNSYFQTLDWYNASGWNEVSFSWNF